MKSEDEPISEDEYLLRRVWIDQFKTNRSPIVSPTAFAPRPDGNYPDTDGISLYREACLQKPEDILAKVDPARIPKNAIVRLPVSFIHANNLSLQPMQDEIKGHVVIPELNVENYLADPERLQPIRLKLAVEASKSEHIAKDAHH